MAITKEQWQEAFVKFQALLGNYKLLKPLAVFQILVQYADQVGAITSSDPAQIAEAVRYQVKDHLLDRNSVGLQRQGEGRPLQMTDLIIQWVPGCEPPALTKHMPKHQASWHEEVAAREAEAEDHLKHLEVRKNQEYWRSQCPGVISGFQPVRRGGYVDHSAIERVTKTLQAYLDRYEAQHAADLEKHEKDKTFKNWSVNWESVCARMQEFVDKAYAVEGRTPQSERI